MFCNKCGKELPEGTKFCSGCGTQLKAPAASQADPGEVPVATNVAPTPQVDEPASVSTNIGGASPAGSTDYKKLAVIGAAVLTVAALVFMFLPWVNYKMLAFDGSSSVLDIAAQSDGTPTVVFSVLAHDNNFQYPGDIPGTALAREMEMFGYLIPALWVIGLVLGAVGLVAIVLGKPRFGRFMILGPAVSSAGCMGVIASLDGKAQMFKDYVIESAEDWYVPYAQSSYEGFGFSAGTWLIVCLVCSIVAFLLYMASNREPLIKK